MKTNEDYLQEYVAERGLSKQTYQTMKIILNHYSEFQNMSLHELLLEADKEEEERLRWKNRKLKTRLISYMNHLRENMTINSTRTYLKLVKAFYNHHEIEIHKLPKINEKNSITPSPITYNDLPDKEIIKQAVEIAEPLMKALILFLLSTGLSKVDALNINIEEFIESTAHYHQNKKLDQVETLHYLQQLSEKVDIIPTFRSRRQKTNKYFITFCSPEATIEIINYLLLRNSKKELNKTDKLFKINPHTYTLKFEEINEVLGLSTVGSYNRFRGHMLRKFHASNLAKAGMDRYLINVLQGKSNGAVDDVYFYEDENHLREEYLKHMHSLLIFSEVKEVTIHSEEYNVLKKENEKLKEQISEIKRMQEDIDKLKEWFSVG